MKPRLLNLATGVSLLLAIAIVVLWIRSYDRYEQVDRTWNISTEQRRLGIASAYCSFDFLIMRDSDASGPVGYGYYKLSREDDMHAGAPTWFSIPPVEFRRRFPPSYPIDLTELTFADWLLLLPTLPLPLIALMRHRRRRRRETNNLCPTCGYDLRATPDRCPECGAVPECKLQISSSKF